jgi:hypothetical protein
MTGGDDGRDRGFLPPFRLPPLFPDDFEFSLPIPERVRTGRRGPLLAAALFDTLDAALTTIPAADLPRTVAGTVLAALLAGVPGVLYTCEVVAAAAGAGALTVAPTLLVLVALRLR